MEGTNKPVTKGSDVPTGKGGSGSASQVAPSSRRRMLGLALASAPVILSLKIRPAHAQIASAGSATSST